MGDGGGKTGRVGLMNGDRGSWCRVRMSYEYRSSSSRLIRARCHFRRHVRALLYYYASLETSIFILHIARSAKPLSINRYGMLFFLGAEKYDSEGGGDETKASGLEVFFLFSFFGLRCRLNRNRQKQTVSRGRKKKKEKRKLGQIMNIIYTRILVW